MQFIYYRDFEILLIEDRGAYYCKVYQKANGKFLGHTKYKQSKEESLEFTKAVIDFRYY